MAVILALCEIDCDPENIDPIKSVELGSYEYVNCYLSTISKLLEGGKWGSRFPVILESLDAKTKIEPEAAEEMLLELCIIKDELKKHPYTELDCGKIDTDDTNWMLEAPFDTFADNLYDYFLNQEEDNLTETLYEYAVEAVDENLSIMYLFV